MLTETRNPKTMFIDQLSTLEIVQVMNQEDAAVPQVVAKTLPDIARAVDAIVEGIRAGGRLIYVGAGTSGRLGILDAAECVPTFSTPPELVQALIAGGEGALTDAVEGAEDRADKGRQDVLALNLTPQDVVVGTAASGRTPYVIGALEAANEIGAVTVAISCNAPAPILDIASIKIAAVTGPEVVTGSTRLKAGTAQKLILNMLSTASMIKLGKVYGNLMVDVQVTNQKLAQRAQRIVAEVVGVSEAEAEQLLHQTQQEVKTAIVVGLLHITPEEARRKLAETHGILRKVIG
ncbi:MAG: N-acetylmuramic acid 6-phosphate etherase [Anaerolineae bacterium]|nr:N-acetylmuramic acid 6-phosphate etherase [Anaerolineae bacterium]